MVESNALNPSTLAEIATGRSEGLFAADYRDRSAELEAKLRGARVLLIGGAGTIGGSVARLLIGYDTAALHIVDANENTLVELTRDLRASGARVRSEDLRWLPLDFGSAIMERFLLAEVPYDFVLNFAAIKHVRSEKDIYSVLRMFETNVVKQHELLTWLGKRNSVTAYFSVSTDKAANPVNLMGASKRLMEHVMFTDREHPLRSTNSARFANVAFSDGSLLHGWTLRIAKGQPLAVPRDTRRFFVSIEEAGELCLLAAFCQQDRQILIPRLSAETDLRPLEQIAVAYLARLGLKAEIYDDEKEGIAHAASDRDRGHYPLLLTPLDTSGEKPFEEFVGQGERNLETGFRHLQSINYLSTKAIRDLTALVDALRHFIATPSTPVAKHDIVQILGQVMPELQHVETGRNLDGRI
jgi:nucleoside-diphosphate-sugar epimerase